MTRRQSGSGLHARGVTSIEVVFIIGIIVLALFVIGPILCRSRKTVQTQSASARCRSNLHQLGVAMVGYAAENDDMLPGTATADTMGWQGMCASTLLGKRQASAPEEVLAMSIFHCPTRAESRQGAFIDYVYNNLNPAGPDESGEWIMPADRRMFKIASYKRPSGVVGICDAEREVQVTDFKDIPSVKRARELWRAQETDWRNEGLHAMTVWKGGHLPQGKAGINTTDGPGPRRVARRMHLGKFTNAVFLDGHVHGINYSPLPLEVEQYAYWLERFGVTEPRKVAQSDDDLY